MMCYYLFLPLFYLIYAGSFIGKTEKTRNAFLDIADSLPVVLLPFLNHNLSSYLFLTGCIFANVLMRPSTFIGGALYLITYGFAGLSTMFYNSFDLLSFLTASILMLAILIVVVFKMRSSENKLIMILGSSLYTIIALIPCLYSFFITWNIGFLCLVLGDITLIVYILGIVKNEFYHYISNCIFYTGVVLTPLVLQNLPF